MEKRKVHPSIFTTTNFDKNGNRFFAKVLAETLNHPKMSNSAKGLLCKLLSNNPKDYDICMDVVAATSSEDYKTQLRHFRELEAYGYAISYRVGNSRKNTKWCVFGEVSLLIEFLTQNPAIAKRYYEQATARKDFKFEYQYPTHLFTEADDDCPF